MIPLPSVLYAQTDDGTIQQTLKNPFEAAGFTEWSALQWAESITVVIGILVLIIVIGNIIFQRRLSPVANNALRLLGLCILPVFLMLFGSFATFEGSRRVEFCASCHSAMSMYVDDLKDGNSETLAALHYKNRYIQEAHCYNCHVDYNLFGTVKGKITGLKHLYYWVSGSPTARGIQQIELYGYYSNQTCLRCHAGSKKFLEADEGVHLENAPELLKKSADGEPGLSCLECHAPAHPSLEEKENPDGGRQ